MIRMINGSTCIDGQIITAANGAFSASPETEKHLVKAGAAEIVGAGTAVPAEGLPDDPFGDPADDTDTARGDLDIPEYSEDSTNAELQSIAKEYGIEVPPHANKTQLLELLNDYFGDMPEIGVKEPE